MNYNNEKVKDYYIAEGSLAFVPTSHPNMAANSNPYLGFGDSKVKAFYWDLGYNMAELKYFYDKQDEQTTQTIDASHLNQRATNEQLLCH